MLLIQHGLSHAWKNGLQGCVTLGVDLRPPLAFAFNFILELRPGCQNSAHSLMNAYETNSISSLIGDIHCDLQCHTLCDDETNDGTLSK
jgi:hypothetical protein